MRSEIAKLHANHPLQQELRYLQSTLGAMINSLENGIKIIDNTLEKVKYVN